MCCEDNADALTHHELLLPGHLLCKILKEKLGDCLGTMATLINKDLAGGGRVGADQPPEAAAAVAAGVNLESEAYLRRVADKLPDLGRRLEYFLNTGNYVSKNAGDLSQTSGFTVCAVVLCDNVLDVVCGGAVIWCAV